jgi:alpha-glucosidase (family GH31 glycosyl hydrolase)
MTSQREVVPKVYGEVSSAADQASTSVTLTSSDKGAPVSTFSFEAIRPNLFRTTFTTPDHPLPPHPSALRPATDFGSVTPKSTASEKSKRIELGGVAAVVDWSDAPVISIFLDGETTPVHQDLNFRSYAIDAAGVAHYTAYKRATLHAGLGEKAAPMDLSNRGFTISATDCFGYDVYRTDPMYKHIPLLINATPNGCAAIFSTSHR